MFQSHNNRYLVTTEASQLITTHVTCNNVSAEHTCMHMTTKISYSSVSRGEFTLTADVLLAGRKQVETSIKQGLNIRYPHDTANAISRIH